MGAVMPTVPTVLSPLHGKGHVEFVRHEGA
jgi:hypothetical protein